MNFQTSSLSVAQFSEMGLPQALLTALEKSQFTTPTTIQSESIPVALSGSDLIGVAQTGSGKTLAYALSVLTALEKKPDARAMILLPSRETAEQTHQVFSELCDLMKITLCLAVTGLPVDKQANQLKKNPRVIVATPGRMADHLRVNKLLLKGLEVLVIDEADRMLDQGFEPQLQFIQSTLRGTRQTLMFAATFGHWAEPIAKIFLRPEAILIRSQAAETPPSTLKQKVFFLNHAQKNNRLLDEVRSMKGGVIIFTDSQESCVSIGRFLEHHEMSADFVHGNMNPGHRNRVLREFREQKIQIMITTDLLARGLDVAHVQHVVSYDLPYKSEDFLHRIGRTARAGRDGIAIIFVTPSDGRSYRKIKGYLKDAVEETLSSTFSFDEDRGN